MQIQGKKKGPVLNQPTKAFEYEAPIIPQRDFCLIVSCFLRKVKMVRKEAQSNGAIEKAPRQVWTT